MKSIKTLGIIGYPLDHSFSKDYFQNKFANEHISEYTYKVFPMETLDNVRSLEDINPGLTGFNVTIPHKENIIPFLDEIDSTANEIGAVNTVRIREGKWVGFNTDIIGFKMAIADWLDQFLIHHALILGTGGAAKAAAYVLDKEDIPFLYISRTGPVSYKDLNEKIIHQADLIINTTPLGMYPESENHPSIPYSCLSEKHFLFDMIYNPEKTIFLARGEQRGARIRNGLKMLHGQAEAAWQLWTDEI